MTKSSKRCHVRHGAFTLIEALVMIALLTAATTVSLSLLSHLVKITDKTTKQSLTIREVARLADRLRDETHRSQVATLERDAMKLVLASPDGRKSEFELRADGVIFRSQQGMAVANDRFQIEPNAAWRFIKQEQESFVSLVLRPASGDREEWRIDARVSGVGNER
jgi:type II secretory pathway pseudopilin PulG